MSSFVIDYWTWWGIGGLLLLVELFTGTFACLWLAVAAALLGALMWIAPGIDWQAQMLLFAGLSALALVLWRRFAGKALQNGERSMLNQRGAQYIGRTFNLIEPIVNGQGRIKVDDTLWKVYGEDCAASCKVKVVAVKGAVFEVVVETD